MVLDQLNYVGIIVASVVSFIVGFLWYSPFLFGNVWMKLNGVTKKDTEKAKKKGMTKMMLLAFIGTLVTASVLNILIIMSGVSEISTAISLSFIIWLGFIVATTLLGSVLWDNKPWGLFLLNGAYWLVNVEIISIVLILCKDL